MNQNIPPSGYNHLTDVQVTKCLALAQFKTPQEEIARELGCNQSTISRVLKAHKYETFQGRVSTPGPARKTTIADDRLLIRIAKKNHTLPFRDITNISRLPISRWTTARRCWEVKLISRYAIRKPFLTDKHKKDRLEWATRYKDWTIEDWLKVIWSDECLMRVGQDPRRRRVLRTDGTGLQENNLTPVFKSQRVTIMIWACFSGHQLGPLLTFEQGGIGADEYMDILFEGLIPMIDDLLTPNDGDTIKVADENTFLFMQDNAPCHKTRDILDLLEEHEIPTMIWPANSPDLNPIENLWRDLKSRFYSEFCKLRTNPSTSRGSYEEYEKILERLWANTDWSYIHSLIESMPQRVDAVIKAKGGHTKY
jgi:DDE superfamily endonuclease/Transposase/Helix-turn-helix domain